MRRRAFSGRIVAVGRATGAASRCAGSPGRRNRGCPIFCLWCTRCRAGCSIPLQRWWTRGVFHSCASSRVSCVRRGKPPTSLPGATWCLRLLETECWRTLEHASAADTPPSSARHAPKQRAHASSAEARGDGRPTAVLARSLTLGNRGHPLCVYESASLHAETSNVGALLTLRLRAFRRIAKRVSGVLRLVGKVKLH